MFDRLKTCYDWFTPARTVGLLLDGSIIYSSWKLYGVLSVLTMGNKSVAVFNAMMMLAVGLILHRVSREIGTTGRIVALLVLYSLKFGTAGAYSLAAYVPEIETLKTSTEKQGASESPPRLTFVRVESGVIDLRPEPPTPRRIVSAGLFVWRAFPLDLILAMAITWFSIVIGDFFALFLEWVHRKVDNHAEKTVKGPPSASTQSGQPKN